jgi:hypothetical protein
MTGRTTPILGQNVRLKDALVSKGYDVNYAWGIGVHSHDMPRIRASAAASIFHLHVHVQERARRLRGPLRRCCPRHRDPALRRYRPVAPVQALQSHC